MIIGIGTDILNIKRISKIIKRYDQKFINRVYGKNEIEIVRNKLKNSDNYFGKRFAAKEATWKALNPLRGDGLFFSVRIAHAASHPTRSLTHTYPPSHALQMWADV